MAQVLLYDGIEDGIGSSSHSRIGFDVSANAVETSHAHRDHRVSMARPPSALQRFSFRATPSIRLHQLDTTPNPVLVVGHELVAIAFWLFQSYCESKSCANLMDMGHILFSLSGIEFNITILLENA